VALQPPIPDALYALRAKATARRHLSIGDPARSALT